MSDTKDGGPAFPARPTEHYGNGVSITSHNGMTLRDYFAAKAMQGLIASPRSPKSSSPEETDVTDTLIARLSYMVADTMLKERDK